MIRMWRDTFAWVIGPAWTNFAPDRSGTNDGSSFTTDSRLCFRGCYSDAQPLLRFNLGQEVAEVECQKTISRGSERWEWRRRMRTMKPLEAMILALKDHQRRSKNNWFDVESRKLEEWRWDAVTCCDFESFQASPLMKAMETFGQNDQRQDWYMGLELDMQRASACHTNIWLHAEHRADPPISAHPLRCLILIFWAGLCTPERERDQASILKSQIVEEIGHNCWHLSLLLVRQRSLEHTRHDRLQQTHYRIMMYNVCVNACVRLCEYIVYSIPFIISNITYVWLLLQVLFLQ